MFCFTAYDLKEICLQCVVYFLFDRIDSLVNKNNHGHTCQLSVIRTESPSFSSRQNLRSRRRKSPSFEHRLCFRFRAIISYFPVIIPMSRHHVQGMQEKKNVYKAHFNPDWVKEWPALIAKGHKGDTDALCRFVAATLAFLRASKKRTRSLL